MATKKKTTNGAAKRKPKPLKFGTTAAEVYRLAEGILDAKHWLIAGIADAQRWLAVSPARVFPILDEPRRYDVEAWGDHKERYTTQLERLRAARQMFEARLVVDPADAVRRVQALKSMTHLDVRQASGGGDPVMKAALAVAVEHVEEWLRQREGKPVAWIPAPAAALQAIALPSAIGERPPEESMLPRRFNADDLERIAKNAAVARAQGQRRREARRLQGCGDRDRLSGHRTGCSDREASRSVPIGFAPVQHAQHDEFSARGIEREPNTPIPHTKAVLSDTPL